MIWYVCKKSAFGSLFPMFSAKFRAAEKAGASVPPAHPRNFAAFSRFFRRAALMLHRRRGEWGGKSAGNFRGRVGGRRKTAPFAAPGRCGKPRQTATPQSPSLTRPRSACGSGERNSARVGNLPARLLKSDASSKAKAPALSRRPSLPSPKISIQTNLFLIQKSPEVVVERVAGL